MPRTGDRGWLARVPGARRGGCGDVKKGSILWLPTKEEVVERMRGVSGAGDGGFEDGCYDHPVVVLWTDGVDGVVLVVSCVVFFSPLGLLVVLYVVFLCV